MSTVELIRLGAFGRQISKIIPDARDLVLLSEIEQTVDVVADLTIKFQAVALITEHYRELLHKELPPDSDALAKLEEIIPECLVATENFYNANVAKRQYAIDDHRLTEDDGIVDAYDGLLGEVSSFYNSLSSLSWIIGEHRAEADVTLPGRHTTVDDLFAAMGV